MDARRGEEFQPLEKLAIPAGLEPATPSLEGTSAFCAQVRIAGYCHFKTMICAGGPSVLLRKSA
jgi:hypothetical protein